MVLYIGDFARVINGLCTLQYLRGWEVWEVRDCMEYFEHDPTFICPGLCRMGFEKYEVGDKINGKHQVIF